LFVKTPKYGEVEIIPEGSRLYPGTAMGYRAGAKLTSENTVRAKFAEFTFYEVG